MGTQKLRDLHPGEVCEHDDHHVDGYLIREDGLYGHTCAGCGRTFRFTVYKGVAREVEASTDADS